VFGSSVSLSADGTRLAVAALEEDSNALGINGDDTNNTSGGSGAAFVYKAE
jgi:hypothetical protein